MLEQDIFFEDFTETAAIQIESPHNRLYSTICLRSVEAVESIYNGRGLLSAPVAGVYRIEYADGSNAEILVMGDPIRRDFRTARFLEKGRLTDQLSQVLKLIIHGQKGMVPEMIKQHLSTYEMTRDEFNQRRYGA